MHVSTTLKRNLFFLLALFAALTLHSTQPSAPLRPTGDPLNPTPAVKVVNKKASFAFFKKVKQQLKKYVQFVRQWKKRYQNDVLMSTILIALLLALGVGVLIYLLAHAGISGIVVTALALVAIGLIIYWAVKRIRWNAQY
jgi:hypothetical protein